jgi:hypothetical protein
MSPIAPNHDKSAVLPRQKIEEWRLNDEEWENEFESAWCLMTAHDPLVQYPRYMPQDTEVNQPRALELQRRRTAPMVSGYRERPAARSRDPLTEETIRRADRTERLAAICGEVPEKQGPAARRKDPLAGETLRTAHLVYACREVPKNQSPAGRRGDPLAGETLRDPDRTKRLASVCRRTPENQGSADRSKDPLAGETLRNPDRTERLASVCREVPGTPGPLTSLEVRKFKP